MRRQVAIESNELRSPLRGERLFEDVAGEPGFSERGGMARRRGSDARLQLVGRRDAAPAPLERSRVACRAPQQLDVRLYLVFLSQRRRNGIALGELGGEATHLVQGPGAALGPQQHARRGDVLGSRLVQVAQRIARRGEIALLERELGAADQPRGLQALPRLLGALEPPVTPLEVAHLVRGARGEQSGEARRRARLEGRRRLLLGPCVAALVVGLQRRGQRGMRALAAATRAKRPNISRKRNRVAEQAHRGVEQQEAGEARHDEEQQRQRSEEHTSELQSRLHLVCRLLLEKKKTDKTATRRLRRRATRWRRSA